MFNPPPPQIPTKHELRLDCRVEGRAPCSASEFDKTLTSQSLQELSLSPAFRAPGASFSRQLFHRPGGGGRLQNNSNALYVYSVSIMIYQGHLDLQASDRFQRLGNLALTLAFSGTWVFCLFVFFPITLGWQKSQLGLNLGVEDQLVGHFDSPRFFLHVHAQPPWISRSGHQNTHGEKKEPSRGPSLQAVVLCTLILPCSIQ